MKKSVYEKLIAAEQSPAWNRASAFVILRGNELVGRIKCKYPKDGMGPLEVFLWDWTHETINTPQPIQYGRATGCGYDKLAAALDGLQFGLITLKDHLTDWKEQLTKAGFVVIQAL